ncbi:MAG: radical SAM protein, partial [Acidobacteria bacterium]
MATCTLTGHAVVPLARSLPRTIRSLCPECLQVIPATEFVEDGRVWMQKRCPTHGDVRDLVFSDAELFLRLESWHFGDGVGFANPSPDGEGACPERCGICGGHTSHTSLANVDLTSRCNLACRVCFADASRHPYELTYEQAVETLRRLRAQRPAPAFAVQFTGGEP